jgi:hypothetical protein
VRVTVAGEARAHALLNELAGRRPRPDGDEAQVPLAHVMAVLQGHGHQGLRQLARHLEDAAQTYPATAQWQLALTEGVVASTILNHENAPLEIASVPWNLTAPGRSVEGPSRRLGLHLADGPAVLTSAEGPAAVKAALLAALILNRPGTMALPHPRHPASTALVPVTDQLLGGMLELQGFDEPRVVAAAGGAARRGDPWRAKGFLAALARLPGRADLTAQVQAILATDADGGA